MKDKYQRVVDKERDIVNRLIKRIREFEQESLSFLDMIEASQDDETFQALSEEEVDHFYKIEKSIFEKLSATSGSLHKTLTSLW